MYHASSTGSTYRPHINTKKSLLQCAGVTKRHFNLIDLELDFLVWITIVLHL
jgi:hypothetical protein